MFNITGGKMSKLGCAYFKKEKEKKEQNNTAMCKCIPLQPYLLSMLPANSDHIALLSKWS